MAKKQKHIDLDQERYGLFMSEESLKLDVMYGREYLKSDAPFKIKYHKINILKTDVQDIYKETKPEDKKFFPAIELHVMLDVEDGETKYFGENGLPRNDTGNLVFGIYLDELKENNLTVSRGDIVAFNFSGDRERFYEITDSDDVSDMSSRSRGGFIPYWKKITAIPVKGDVIPLVKSR